MSDNDDFDSVNDIPQTEDISSQAPVDDTDLSGMDAQSAKEYVLAFITSLKQLEKQIEDNKKDLTLWQERIKLTEQRNETELLAKAQQRVSEIETKLASLELEREELRNKVIILKENLKKQLPLFSRSVDTDNLLAHLEMIVGEPDKTEQAFKKQEAEAELEKLKKKLQEEE